MDYEEAVLALQAGDYDRAVRLFAPAARDANYRSDVINHFYTLALHHAGENAKLAEVAFEVGNRMLSDDAASALDYFQRALVAGLSARKTRQIGVVFEQWASRIGRGGEKTSPPRIDPQGGPCRRRVGARQRVKQVSSDFDPRSEVSPDRIDRVYNRMGLVLVLQSDRRPALRTDRHGG